MNSPKSKFILMAAFGVTFFFGFLILSPSLSGFSSFTVEPAFAGDPGCTNEDCPPDPGCTNEDCPPDPGCTNEDCPPDYWAGCCCYEEYNPATERTERICCCNEGQHVLCRWSYVTDPVAPMHETISDIFVEMDSAPDNEQALCMPDWFLCYLGDAWVPLGASCDWWSRLQECPLATGVIIDIKPGSDPNCFNVNGNGVIPVAIKGSQGFDVHEVDASSLRFAGLEIGVRGNGNPQCGYNDTDGDGYVDLVCQFTDDPYLWSPGDGEAVLTGNLLDTTPIQGRDSICVVP